MSVTEITSEEHFVSFLTDPSYQYVFVDFHAIWCGPCRRISPKITEYSKLYPQVKFVKVDVDVLGDLATRYKVQAMPTFIVIKSGTTKALYTIVGADADQIDATLKKL